MKLQPLSFVVIFIFGFFVLYIQEKLFVSPQLKSLLTFANVVAVQADEPSDYVPVGGKIYCTLPNGVKAPVKNARFDIEGYSGKRLAINNDAKYLQNDQVSSILGRWKTSKVAGFWRIKYDNQYIDPATPNQITTSSEQAVTGNGKATKEQVSFMVKRLLGIKKEIKPLDITDAIAIALTHSQRIKG